MNIDLLKANGFNVAEALELCVDDEEIYAEVLDTALEEGREKLVLFEELMSADDMSRYTIEAHGLKNAAKQIGADELSELAKASEFDGKEGRISDLKARHSLLMEKYRKVCDVVEEAIK